MNDKQPYTLSDRYAFLMGLIDEYQAKVQKAESIKVKVYYQNEVEKLQKETKQIQETMVDHGDLEFLPWINNKEIRPLIKIQPN